MRHPGAIVLLLCMGCSASDSADGGRPVQPTGPTVPSPSVREVFLDQQADFEDAVRDLGTRHVVDFEDVDARPVTDTIRDRAKFDGQRYLSRGMAFSNPNNLSFYIAPAGLFWNPTNSLSVGRFPFDPLPQTIEAPFVEDDDLVVAFEPGCVAAAFSAIDKAYPEDVSPDNVVEFLDAQGDVIHRLEFRYAFIGVVSRTRPIARIVVWEAANDGDDVTYDDFVCVR